MAPSLDAPALWSAAMAPAWLVAPASLLVAAVLLARVTGAKPAEALRWRLAAALVLGTGIWATQVIGLTALALPFPVGYHPLGALAAWTLAVAASLVGLLLSGASSGRAAPAWRAWAAAGVLAAGMIAAQWVLMVAIGFRPGLRWRWDGSVAALLAAGAGSALSLALMPRGQGVGLRRWAGQLAVAALWGATTILSQHLVIGAADLHEQAFSAHERRLAAGSLSLLATLGALALPAVMLLLSRIEAGMRASLARTRSELAQDSLRDTLTKLPNRLSFEGTLAQAAAQADQRRGRLALLFINIDRFKHVNEGLGNHGGDRLLCEIATRLRGMAGPHMVARVGGDEFALLLNEDPAEDDVADLAAALLKRLGEPCKLEGQDSAVSCSIGIAMYPRDGAQSRIMSHADCAMRECKSTGGASYCFFEARMMSGVRERAELLRDLRQALARRELELFYQPKVHAPTGEITGAEALIRWRHPRRGLVSPTVFVPVAERFGLIKEIGDWVIDEACRQARAWRDQGLRMRVAINLSPFQLRDPDLGRRIEAALKKHQINPKLLTCEITESVAMEDSQATAKFFAVLAGVGVHISIDDFGTGYSSLSYLRKLPAEELKIDRSFVCDLESSDEACTVAGAVVKLGQALNLKVVAEGVETEAQHQILRSLGCDELQGYLFAKPMSAKALGMWAINDVGPKPIVFRPSLFQPTAPTPIH